MESRHPAEWIMNFEISRRYPSVPWQSSYLQSILHSFSVFIFFTWFFCFLIFAFSASFSHSGANFWQWLHLNRGQIADRLADRHFRSLYISGQTECESHTSIMINHDQSCGFLELWLEQLQVCMWTQCGDTGLKCKTWKHRPPGTTRVNCTTEVVTSPQRSWWMWNHGPGKSNSHKREIHETTKQKHDFQTNPVNPDLIE